MPATKPPEGGHYIFRPWRKLPNGTVIYAKAYGLKAFKIFVPDDTNDEGKKPK